MRSQLSHSAQRKSHAKKKKSPKRGFPLLRILLALALLFGLNRHFGFFAEKEEGETRLAAISLSSSSLVSPKKEKALPKKESVSSASVLSSAPPQREWFRMESKSLGQGRSRLAYRFPADHGVWSALEDTARIPETLRPFVVEALLSAQEFSLPLEATFVVDADGEPLSWGWKAGVKKHTYTLSSRGWIDDRGCYRGSPCPWKNFGALAGHSLPGGVWVEPLLPGAAVYSYLDGQLADVRQEKEGWSVVVYRAPEIYAEWSGLRQLAPTVRTGALVDAGAPLGSAGEHPISLRVWVLGRPVDPQRLWSSSWNLPVQEEVMRVEG